MRLNAVYVPLTTSARAYGPEHDRLRNARLDPAESRESLLLSRLGEESLYGSGSPGAGKSTFCRWVAWLTCEGAVPPAQVEPPEGLRETLPASLTGRLPLLVPMRGFWPALFEDGGREASVEPALAAWIDRENPPGLTGKLLGDHLREGRTLLILDGLDEVPSDRRGALVEALAQAIERWHAEGNRLLVTSRPYGLTETQVARLGLTDAPIGGLSDSLQHVLVRRWFRILLEQAAEADRTTGELLGQVAAQRWLAPLTSNPLLLTAMCIVYGDGKRLPEDKYELYDRVVDTVLHSRIPDRARLQLVRGRLAVVAYGMHTGAGLDEKRASPEAQVTDEDIERMLRAEPSECSDRSGRHRSQPRRHTTASSPW